MDKELLKTLSNLFDEKLKPIQNDIKGIHGEIKDMQGNIKGIHGEIKVMQGDITDLKNSQTRFEIKLDNVVEQTANLTEFRNLTISRLDDITDNLNKVESITASNWKDITKLKSVK